jgi:hypothetical protein
MVLLWFFVAFHLASDVYPSFTECFYMRGEDDPALAYCCGLFQDDDESCSGFTGDCSAFFLNYSVPADQKTADMESRCTQYCNGCKTRPDWCPELKPGTLLIVGFAIGVVVLVVVVVGAAVWCIIAWQRSQIYQTVW